jgi:hypothetical protein
MAVLPTASAGLIAILPLRAADTTPFARCRQQIDIDDDIKR